MKIIFLLNVILFSLPLRLLAEEMDTHGIISPEIEKTVTLYSKILLPCDKVLNPEIKCNFHAIYDNRDDYIYIVKKEVNSENKGYGAEGFNREEVIANSHQSIDMVKEFPEKSTEVSNSSAFFSYQNNDLKLKLKLTFTEEVKSSSEKEIIINY